MTSLMQICAREVTDKIVDLYPFIIHPIKTQVAVLDDVRNLDLSNSANPKDAVIDIMRNTELFCEATDPNTGEVYLDRLVSTKMGTKMTHNSAKCEFFIGQYCNR